MPSATFELQGHRGARGLKSENTLPSFEVAFDLGVSSVETDVHMTADNVPILFHDSNIDNRFQPGMRAGDASFTHLMEVRSMALAEIRECRVDFDPKLCPIGNQNNEATPLALLFAELNGIHPFTMPTVAELFAFAAAYAGHLGWQAGKSDEQRCRASEVRFDLELKQVPPLNPPYLGEPFDSGWVGILERPVIQVVHDTGMVGRTRIRSFDSACVREVGELEPDVERALLTSGFPLIPPEVQIRQANAQIYCPEVEFLDERQVRQIHEAGFRVLPWTVNDPKDWQQLIDWGVDGITTDFPNRLAEFLTSRGIAY